MPGTLHINIDVNSVLGLLHHVDVGDTVDLSELHDASIFRVVKPQNTININNQPL
jgi:hypothetical protein